MSGLKFYTDPFSPVCRSVSVFMAANKIPYEEVKIDLSKGEHTTREDLISINPCQRVPGLDDNGFKMFESTAILCYLAQKYKVPDHWYPSDPQARAKLNEALSWFNGNLRCGCLFHHAVYPVRTGKPRNEVKCAELRSILKKALDMVENYFLKDKKFVCGDEISIADLQFLGEISHYWIADVYPSKGRLNMERWIEDCKKALAPHYEPVFNITSEVRKTGTYHAVIDVQ